MFKTNRALICKTRIRKSQQTVLSFDKIIPLNFTLSKFLSLTLLCDSSMKLCVTTLKVYISGIRITVDSPYSN